MTTEIMKALEKLSIEIDELRKSSNLKKLSKEVKLKRYHALLNRISRCIEVNTTPDELISSLKRKDY
jgi:hypothetical protein